MTKPLLYVGNRNYSSWSLRPFMALAMAGVDFETRLLRFDIPGFADKAKRVSKAGLVPILKHNSVVVWDSLAILEYAAETWPNANLWPKNKAARAMARSACAEMHSGFKNLRNALPMNIRRPKKAIATADPVLADIARVQSLWIQCRKDFGKGGPFLFGKFSNADAMFTPVVSRLETFDVKVSHATREYMNAILATPAFHEWQEMALQEPWVYPADEVD